MKHSIKFILFVIFVSLFFQTNFGQSCGGGTTTFHIFDENGFVEIKDYYVSLHIVSEDQSWRIKDFSKFGWKLQIFDEKTVAKYGERRGQETAFQIPSKEYIRLMENRAKILKVNPKSIVSKEINRCKNSLQGSPLNDKPFSVCTVEGCSFMVVAEIQAKDYETAYFVSDFTCGCSKHYEFRLKIKRDKCLPK